MKNALQKSDVILKSANKMVVDMPSPSNISIWWNFGSLSGICLATQIFTGMFLAMFYTSDTETSFNSIDQIMRNVNYGWIMRIIHANGASFMFICLYIHMGRTLYYSMFMKMNKMWESGVTIFILTMATAFFGYILPWGQMSFWGATVITSLFSAIPSIGKILVEWIWGGFAVDSPTLTRFFSLHFITPFIIIMFMIIHIIFLHMKGSTNPMGIKNNSDKISMHMYFSTKDITGFLITIVILIFMSLMIPYVFMEPDNFLPANPLVTPPHIQPEWYFLFAYTILRSIPNKLGGVISLAMSLIILYLLPILIYKKKEMKMTNMKSKIMFWLFLNTFFMLTWIGMCQVEFPFESIGKTMSIMYFLWFIITPMMSMKT